VAKCDIIVTPTGEVRFMMREGEYEEASARLTSLLGSLSQAGLKITAGKIEKHAHGPREAQTHSQHT
jgi:hypothetical protein